MMELSEATGLPISDNPVSVWEKFLETAYAYPDDLAVASMHQPPNLFGIPSVSLAADVGYSGKPYLRWTFKSLLQGVTRLTASLKAAGVESGMPMITFQPNGTEHILSLWAAAAIGCLFVPINPLNLVNRVEVKHMIQTTLDAAPGRRPVVLVADSKSAIEVSSLGLCKDPISITLSSVDVPDGWITFDKLMEVPLVEPAIEDLTWHRRSTDGGAVLFTSGTTSLPKGIYSQKLTHAMFLESWTKSRPRDGVVARSKIYSILPNNHSFGHYMAICTHCIGAAIVISGPNFDANAMLETLYIEQITQYVCSCQYTIVTPTVIHAVATANSVGSKRPVHLTQVVVGGAVLSSDLRRSCREEFNTNSIENWYGMTEGLVVRPGSQMDTETVVDGEEASIGWVMPGYSVRIVDPATNMPVPVNTRGELHGSSEIIREYLGGVGAESYYTGVDGRLWFKSGDQARMDAKGRIFITGRYKDIIIRGGVNLSPVAIETAIRKDAKLVVLNPQVVGVPDSVAGEVPVAVILGNVSNSVTESVQKAVATELGNSYSLDEIISAQKLGLSDYPRTMAGKIQKTKLAELVKIYRAGREHLTSTSNRGPLSDIVKDAWARATGLKVSQLSLTRPLGEFTDSITMIRARSLVQRETGKSLTSSDMAKADTIQKHIELLEKHASDSATVVGKRSTREGPPDIDDMVHLAANPTLFDATKTSIIRTISDHGFGWEDVEDVAPVYDYYTVMGDTGTFDTWRLQYAILTNTSTKSDVRKALETVFINNRILASFVVRDRTILQPDIALHVMMRQNKKMFDVIIQDGGAVKTIADVRAISTEYPYRNHATLPGPLAHAIMYHVEETGSIAVVACISHSVADASSAEFFRTDLDLALGGASLHEHVDFKPYADSYYNLRTSAIADAAVQWHVKRLSGLGVHTKALEQPFPVPKDVFEARSAGGRDRVRRPFHARGLEALQRAHPHISANILVKAAFTLVQTYRTGHTHALFQSFEAARTVFPFQPRSLETSSMFDAADVGGPTTQGMINLVKVDDDQTVLSFLNDVQAEQLNLTRHASAPLNKIIQALGPAGKLVPDILRHQGFNWLPLPLMGGIRGSQYSNMELIDFHMRPAFGFFVMAGLGGPNSDTIFLSGVGQMVEAENINTYLAQIEKVALWLADGVHWESNVGNFSAALAG